MSISRSRGLQRVSERDDKDTEGDCIRLICVSIKGEDAEEAYQDLATVEQRSADSHDRLCWRQGTTCRLVL
jgi:hypothetical protein